MVCAKAGCIDTFEPYHSRQKYCSTACRESEGRKRWISAHGGRRNIPALIRQDRSIGKRFSVLKFAAKLRGIKVSITRDAYAMLITQPCYWCGGTRPRTGGGIDRKDNAQGYNFENCVPCCTQCNNAKNNYSPEIFLDWIIRVYKKHVDNSAKVV